MVSIAVPARAPRLRRRALAACATLFLLLGAGSTTAGAASADSSSNGSLLPGDPFQSKQWYLSWQDRPGSPSTGKSASVGIIDTGVDALSPRSGRRIRLRQQQVLPVGGLLQQRHRL